MSAPLAESHTPRLRAIAASDRPLAPHECAERARQAAALIEPGRLDRSGPGEAVLLWRDEHSEAWLNLWWQPRDTGYHDHTGSCVGVHVIEGRAWHEPLTIGKPLGAREYGPGETFWLPGEGIHRMDHQAGAITVHVYSPPIQVIGHYDLHDGQLRRTQYLPDQPSPPSAALYEALHHPAGANPAGHRQAANLSHLLWGHAVARLIGNGSGSRPSRLGEKRQGTFGSLPVRSSSPLSFFSRARTAPSRLSISRRRSGGSPDSLSTPPTCLTRRRHRLQNFITCGR